MLWFQTQHQNNAVLIPQRSLEESDLTNLKKMPLELISDSPVDVRKFLGEKSGWTDKNFIFTLCDINHMVFEKDEGGSDVDLDYIPSPDESDLFSEL